MVAIKQQLPTSREKLTEDTEREAEAVGHSCDCGDPNCKPVAILTCKEHPGAPLGILFRPETGYLTGQCAVCSGGVLFIQVARAKEIGT